MYDIKAIYADGELVIKHLATDKIPPGHMYYADIQAGPNSRPLTTVNFQNGPIPECGTNGLTNEALLTILIHRTMVLNEQYPCAENEAAIEFMNKARDAFEARTINRKARGVEGKLVK